jgi:hypothetical protein
VHVQFVLVMYAPSFRPFVSEIDIRWSAGRPAARVAIISKSSATFELNGFLLNLPERTTVCSVVLCSRPLRRRDDKQSDPNKYGQQNRQGDKSAKSGQKPNQTPGQQTQNPNQGGQQSGGQQRGPQR